jgi:NitT/TauT family transport system substrate-binding protein
VLFDSSQIPGEIVTVLAARSDVISRSVEALQRVAQGWDAGVAYLQANPRAAADLVGRRERSTPELFAASLELLRFANRAESSRALAPGDNDFARMLQKTASFMQKHDLLPNAVDASVLREDRVVRPG